MITIPHPRLSFFNVFLHSLNEENEGAPVDMHSEKEFGVSEEPLIQKDLRLHCAVVTNSCQL